MTDEETPPEVSPQQEALARLQEQLAEERERRREERFIWIVVALVLVDMIMLGPVQNVALPIVILVLELIGLTVLAKRMGIASAAVALDRVTAAIMKKETS